MANPSNSPNPPNPPNPPRPKVYRLQNLPAHVDRLAAAELLASTFPDAVSPADIYIYSLASTLHSWAQPTKVATLMFRKLPAGLNQFYGSFEIDQWNIRLAGFSEPLILDTHFRGMTPLSDPQKSDHTHE